MRSDSRASAWVVRVAFHVAIALAFLACGAADEGGEVLGVVSPGNGNGLLGSVPAPQDAVSGSDLHAGAGAARAPRTEGDAAAVEESTNDNVTSVNDAAAPHGPDTPAAIAQPDTAQPDAAPVPIDATSPPWQPDADSPGGGDVDGAVTQDAAADTGIGQDASPVDLAASDAPKDTGAPPAPTCVDAPKPEPAGDELLPTAPGSGKHTVIQNTGSQDDFLWGPADAFKVGLREQWGGALVYFGPGGDTPGLGPGNLLDGTDMTRCVRSSFYDPLRAAQGCAWSVTCLTEPQKACSAAPSYVGWHPVQTCNECGIGAPLESIASASGSLEVIARMMHWNPDWAAKSCVNYGCGDPAFATSKSYVRIRQRARFVASDVVELRLRARNHAGDQHAAAGQEFPLVHSAAGAGGTADLSVVRTSEGKLVELNESGDDGEFHTTFTSPGGWVMALDASEKTGVGLYAENRAQSWRLSQKSTSFNAFHALFPFGMGAQDAVNARAYLLRGDPSHLAEQAAWLDLAVPPFGALDAPEAESAVSGPALTITGWALDNVGVTGVEVRVDGQPVGTVAPTEPREDVCEAWPGYVACPNVGFSLKVPTAGLDACGHLVEAIATDTHGNTRTIGRARVFTAGALPPKPELPPGDADTKPRLRVFVLAGGSSMVGSAEVSALDGKQSVPPKATWIFADGTLDPAIATAWDLAYPGYGSDSKHFGPEVGFAQRMRALWQKPALAIVKLGVTDSSLAADWKPGSGPLYKKLVAHVKGELGKLSAEWTPELVGVGWLQGEADSWQPSYAGAYGTNLAAFVAALRQDLGAPLLPVAIGLLPVAPSWPGKLQVRQAQQAFASLAPQVQVFDTSDLTVDAATQLGFDAPSTLELGLRLADALFTRLDGAWSLYDDFSPLQGQNAWNFLQLSPGGLPTPLLYQPDLDSWTGTEPDLWISPKSIHPGNVHGAEFVWTAPYGGVAKVLALISDISTNCNSPASIDIVRSDGTVLVPTKQLSKQGGIYDYNVKTDVGVGTQVLFRTWPSQKPGCGLTAWTVTILVTP